MSKILFIGLLAITLTSIAGEVVSVRAEATQTIGADMSQNQACDLALSKAKKDALTQHFGILTGQKTMLECDATIQKQTGNDCELFESSWSLINSNGFIKQIINRQQVAEFSPELETRVCRVSAKFMIEEFNGIPDASFETKISINSRTLSVRDHPRLSIESNRAAFHYVFFWSPNIDRKTYYRLFPNAADDQSNATRVLNIPSTNAKKNYVIEVKIPKSLSISREYLILLSFKEAQPDVPESISESGFNNWLQTKARDLWKQDTISYRILGE
jgi:hypothetical protein